MSYYSLYCFDVMGSVVFRDNFEAERHFSVSVSCRPGSAKISAFGFNELGSRTAWDRTSRN